ncbi:hypothetical protein HanHA300_Chr01g0022341 [Helianthus annuus]|nr:hypothetical protein HanHA300_Chr01g0022341 [Helianthus annuus]
MTENRLIGLQALDEKQNEAIESAANELARRKGVLDENLSLAHELKVTEDERYIFMSSLVGLLAEYGILPRVTNAAALSDSIKDQQRFSPSPYNNSTGGRQLESNYDVSKYTTPLNGQMNQSQENDNRHKFESRPVRLV